jgi:hypothetical protein
MPSLSTDIEPLERPTQLADLKAARRELADNLLAAARGDVLFEYPETAGELAAAFLRRYDDRRSTQNAYALDLADWFVWLARAGSDPLEATLATIESYKREPLLDGKAPAPSTMARRLACLSHFYRRAQYDGMIARNPVEFADRPRVPDQAATAGISKQRARRLIAAARAEGPRELLLVLLRSSSAFGSLRLWAPTSRISASRAATAC